jgi:DNA-directed RNA polymerase specialized sigma24 family protein
MKNYKESDYALNKYSAGIVYRFADGTTVTYTLEDYLTENPSRTGAGFRALKKMSDNDYLDRANSENVQTYKNSSYEELEKTQLMYAPSPEDMFIKKLDAQVEAERHERRLKTSRRALDTLTEVQRRRYLMYHADGMTLRQIAEKEGSLFTKIQKSIGAAEKKIKKFLSQA